MASRVILYGKSGDSDVKRLKRELNVMYVEFEQSDPKDNPGALQRVAEAVGTAPTLPLVEIQRVDGDGAVYLVNPDEPTLRHSLLTEDILSVSSYWI